MDEKKETKETYNENARVLAKKFDDGGTRTNDIKKSFSFTKKKNPFVFEIGSGNGRDAKEIVKRTSNYLGIDYSEEMIKLAKNHVPEGKFELADVEIYDFPKNIDIIFAFASLLHLNSLAIKNVLDKSHKALDENGILFLSLKHGEGKVKKVDDFGSRTFFLYTPEKIKEMIEGKFKALEEDIQKLRSQRWFEIILQKI